MNDLTHLLNKSNVCSTHQHELFSNSCTKNDATEFHEHDNDLFMETVNNLRLQGCFSMRKSSSEKMHIVFGHDESMFQPHSLKGHVWSIEGQTPKINKI